MGIGLKNRARRAIAWARGAERPVADGRAMVLMYHRVCVPEADPWKLAVAPSRFAEHMEVLRREFAPVSLARLSAGLERGLVPPRGVVVTFDDGYSDVLEEAAPSLSRFDVPATAFLVSRRLGPGREFWWDELEGLLLRPGALPRVLSIRAGGADLEWDLGDDAVYRDEDFARDRGWTAWGEPDPTARHLAFRELWAALQRLPDEERAGALDVLRSWAGREPLRRASYRTLSADEVSALVSGGLVEVGAHTTSHAALSALDAESQRREIRQSKRDLEEIVGRRVTSFAYPYGRRCDYTDETVSLVRDAGFECACSNFDGVVVADASRYELPRMHVGDWDGDELSRRLSTAFAGG